MFSSEKKAKLSSALVVIGALRVNCSSHVEFTVTQLQVVAGHFFICIFVPYCENLMWNTDGDVIPKLSFPCGL